MNPVSVSAHCAAPPLPPLSPLPAEKRSKIHDAFNKFGKSGNGSLTHSEMKAFFIAGNPNMEEREIEEVYTMVGKTEDGRVQVDDLITWLYEHEKEAETDDEDAAIDSGMSTSHPPSPTGARTETPAMQAWDVPRVHTMDLLKSPPSRVQSMPLPGPQKRNSLPVPARVLTMEIESGARSKPMSSAARLQKLQARRSSTGMLTSHTFADFVTPKESASKPATPALPVAPVLPVPRSAQKGRTIRRGYSTPTIQPDAFPSDGSPPAARRSKAKVQELEWMNESSTMQEYVSKRSTPPGRDRLQELPSAGDYGSGGRVRRHSVAGAFLFEAPPPLLSKGRSQSELKSPQGSRPENSAGEKKPGVQSSNGDADVCEALLRAADAAKRHDEVMSMKHARRRNSSPAPLDPGMLAGFVAGASKAGKERKAARKLTHDMTEVLRQGRMHNLPEQHAFKAFNLFKAHAEVKPGMNMVHHGRIPKAAQTKLMSELFRCPEDEVDEDKVFKAMAGALEDPDHGLAFGEFIAWFSSISFDEEVTVDDENKVLRDLARKYNVCYGQIDKYKRNFDKFDEDASGLIDKWEFEHLIYTLARVPKEIGLPTQRMQQLWRIADLDGSGGIDFEEFIQFYMKYFDVSAEAPGFEDFYRSIRRHGRGGSFGSIH